MTRIASTPPVPSTINVGQYPNFLTPDPLEIITVPADPAKLFAGSPVGLMPLSEVNELAVSDPLPASSLRQSSIPSGMIAQTRAKWVCLTATQSNNNTMNFTNAVTVSVSKETTETLSGTLGVDVKGISASVTGTYSVDTTNTVTTEKTVSQTFSNPTGETRTYVAWQLYYYMGITMANQTNLVSFEGRMRASIIGGTVEFNPTGIWCALPAGQVAYYAYDGNGNQVG